MVCLNALMHLLQRSTLPVVHPFLFHTPPHLCTPSRPFIRLTHPPYLNDNLFLSYEPPHLALSSIYQSCLRTPLSSKRDIPVAPLPSLYPTISPHPTTTSHLLHPCHHSSPLAPIHPSSLHISVNNPPLSPNQPVHQ